jgi:hypothetical protein
MSELKIINNQYESKVGTQLNRDLVERLNELAAGAYTTSECWSSCRPLIREAWYWIGLGAILWIAAVLIVR